MRHREEANRDRLAWLMVICHLLLQLVANVFMAVWALKGRLKAPQFLRLRLTTNSVQCHCEMTVKEIFHATNGNCIIIYLPSCNSKHICGYFLVKRSLTEMVTMNCPFLEKNCVKMISFCFPTSLE